MQQAPRPPTEQERLERLRELFVLDTAPEPVFDAITRMASQICGVPIALISLIDHDRQWFKAQVGLPGTSETPRDLAFCAHAVLDDALLEVPDALLDPRFADNPFVLGEPDVRFYAGAPLILAGGERVGTLCVIDRSPRRLDATQVQMLRSLAALTTEALVMRRDLLTRTLSVRTDYETALAAHAEALRRVTANQQAILDTDLVGIVKLHQRRILWANKGAEKLLGYRVDELVGQPSRMLYPDDEAHRRLGEMAYPNLHVGQLFRTQFEMRRKDGALVWVDMSATALPDNPADPLCMLVDITPLKRAEETRMRALAIEAENRQLLEANRVKGLFLANMSHELRTPLNAVIGYADLLLGGKVPHDSPRFARYLKQIGASGSQLLALIETVLDFATVESGRIEFKPVAVRLQSVITEVAETLDASLRARAIALEISIAPSLVEVTTDALRLAQVLSHCLSNAIKFSHPGGRVRLTARPEGEAHFAIDIEDHGIGIAAQDMPLLFSAFRQLSQGSAKAYAGAGLGLALTRRLVEGQGGWVSARSVEGAGSVFTLALPLR